MNKENTTLPKEWRNKSLSELFSLDEVQLQKEIYFTGEEI